MGGEKKCPSVYRKPRSLSIGKGTGCICFNSTLQEQAIHRSKKNHIIFQTQFLSIQNLIKSKIKSISY